MDVSRFARLLLIHGADLKAWPDEVRPEAEALLAQSAEAMRLRDEIAGVDRAVREAPGSTSPLAVEQIVARVANADELGSRPPGLAGDRTPPRLPVAAERRWMSVGVLVAVTLVGVIVGGMFARIPQPVASGFIDLLAKPWLAGYES